MQGIKREQIEYNQKNKKVKFGNEVISNFEDLANEIFYEIFEYLDMYDIYHAFYHLNNRFKNLLLHSNLPIKINLSTITKSNFEDYYMKMILLNQHRINILRLFNPFIIDIIFFPSFRIPKFVQLQILILENLNIKSFNKISFQLQFLPKLTSLILDFAEYIPFPSSIFSQIFSLPKLKSCQISYREKDEYRPLPIHLTKDDLSPIEYLVINTRFPIETLDELLYCLPKLRSLSINCLIHSRYIEIKNELYLKKLNDLKYISFKLDSIDFNQLKYFIKNSFYSIEVLRLTTKFDESYLNAKEWEELIVSFMPKLRIFDINHQEIIYDVTHRAYHHLINQFNSSFWIAKQWFFTHQYGQHGLLKTGIFYSINPYRRKDYQFYWQRDETICLDLQAKNKLNAVKHVHIQSKKATINSMHSFPYATKLTIEDYFQTRNNSIPKTLQGIIHLKQLRELVIQSDDFSLKEIIKLIRFTPYLSRLKFCLSSWDQMDCNSIEQSQLFQYVRKQNQIKYLDLQMECTLEIMQLMIHLFPRLEYLKTGMNKIEINEIVRYLLSKTDHLVFLCITEIPKRCLKELKLLIQSENLLNDYFIKFINRDLYLSC